MKPHPCRGFAALLIAAVAVAACIRPAAGAEPTNLPPTKYKDGRPQAGHRMQAIDDGIVLPYGSGPGGCDVNGAREASVIEDQGVYYLYYDGCGDTGWLACLATSKDLRHWSKKGVVLQMGRPGTMDAKTATSPWFIKEGDRWHMFYVGSPHNSGAPDWVPTGPYMTLKAIGASPSGPWEKQYDIVPFTPQKNTYYGGSASPGFIIQYRSEYLMYFSGQTYDKGTFKRTLGIARTRNLNEKWAVDPNPVVPLDEQIENSSLYYEPGNRTWFLFTNHIGINDNGNEYTDALWVYWSQDPDRWDRSHNAIVLDNTNTKQVKGAIGMPSVIKVGKRLAVFYDGAPGCNFTHMKRSIGLAWLDLPLNPF